MPSPDPVPSPDPLPDLRRLWRLLCVVVAATGLLLGGRPELDIAASGLFFAEGGWTGGLSVISAVRYGLWYASLGLVGLALVGLLVALLRRGQGLGFPGRVWGFILALYVIAPGIIANLILKEHWGRARPADIAEFGGLRDFTPFWLPADQCASNCSFVSGEGAAAMALGISLWVLIRSAGPRIAPTWRRLGLGVAMVVPVLGAAQRLISGRHFLSDLVMAAAIVSAVALVLHALIWRHPGPRR